METEHPDSAHGDRTPRLCSWRLNTPTLLMETEHPDCSRVLAFHWPQAMLLELRLPACTPVGLRPSH
eukprot:366087-Chlamydomonas_euryale.AAC.8